MNVKKVYQTDVYCRRLEAVIREAILADDGFDLYLDQTIFFPEGGGQSADRGQIQLSLPRASGKEDLPRLSFDVVDVQQDGEDIRHRIRLADNPPDDAPDLSSLLAPGSVVCCILDWNHRFDNMQRHCGEHILSGMFHREYGGVNRGFHMGDDYMTIDIRLEGDSTHDTLTYEMALHAERCANQAIWENQPVITRRFSTRQEAAHLPLRKPLQLDEEISIVCVGDPKNPSDCVACCGTHPSSAGQVGLVKVFKVEKNKDMVRVYFEAGARALSDYDDKHELVQALGQMFSAGSGDLLQKIQAACLDRDQLHQSLTHLKKELVKRLIDEINASSDILFDIDPLDAGDGLHIGKKLDRPFTALYSDAEQTALFFSDGSLDCGQLVRDHGLQGGGKETSARVMGSREQITTLVKSLL